MILRKKRTLILGLGRGENEKGAEIVESAGTRRFWDVDVQEATQVNVNLEVNKKDERQLQMIKNESDDN